MTTLPLFPTDASAADPIDRDERLRAIFSDWIAYRAQSNSTARNERALREESAKVYQEMWHAFAAHCAQRKLDIVDISAADIRAFLQLRSAAGADDNTRIRTKGPKLSPRYAWRMLTLIERVTRFHAEREGIALNGAARELLHHPEYRYANAGLRDPLPDYYGDAQARQLIAYLTRGSHAGSTAGPLSWKEVRDRTAVAMMLGGGLAPGDVRALEMNGVTINGGRKAGVPWKLGLPGNGNSPARETPLADWAGQQLAFWLAVREEQKIAGTFVFPSTLTGKPWSHTACHEAGKAVLAGAGMGQDSGGIFKLRHTFALRQLAKGKSETEVARWLGLLDINGMARYRRVVPNQVDLA